MAYGPSTRTVADIRRTVQRAFGDESGVSLEDADIFMWINDAQDEIVNRNKILKGTTSTSSVVGQADYTISSAVRIHQIEAVHYDGLFLKNIPFVEAEQTIISSTTLTDSGTPELWYEWAGTFTFWPTPATVVPILFYLTLRPARVSAVTDLLSVPDKYYRNVANYVLQQAYEMSEDWQASQLKGKQFDTSLADMGEEERIAQNMTNARVQVID